MRRPLARLLQRFSRPRAHNHLDPAGPRFAGNGGRGGPARPALRIVTFNVRFARRIDRALLLFESSEALREADLVALQEMDEQGVDRIASRLGLHYVYYPAVVHPVHGRNFGNALLSRWRIEDDRKVILPHRGGRHDALRIAVGGTVAAGRRRVRAYSVHLGTPLEIRRRQREGQMEAVLADAAGFRGLVVIVGDMNARGIGHLLESRGYLWGTRSVRRTIGPFAWDHIFVGGPGPHRVAAAGVVRDRRGASDHWPVWLALDLDPS